MKTYITILLLFVSILSYSQITTLGELPKKEKTVEIPIYDSMTSINPCYPFADSPYQKSYKHLIGQKVYVVNNSCRYHFKRFVWYGFDSKNVNWDVKGHYMLIIDSEQYSGSLEESDQTHSYHAQWFNALDIAFQDETDGHVYYYEKQDFFNINDKLVVIGHFEKMKQLFEGKELVFVQDDQNNDGWVEYRQNGIFDLCTRNRLEKISKGVVFVCTGVSIDDNNSDNYIQDRVVILLHNDDLGDCYCYATSQDMRETYDKKIQTRCEKYILGKFLSPEDYAKKQKSDAIAAKAKKEADKAKAEEDKAKAEERKQKEQQRIQALVEKYGQSNVNLARQGKVKVGWNKELCKEAWGEPKSVNKTTTAYGVREQWVYYGNRYLYFDNGILTAIQE